jgi:hypothetical protein
MRLSDDALEVAETAAAALGITRDFYLDELLRKERGELGSDGRPKWWVKPLPRDRKELPLKTST